MLMKKLLLSLSAVTLGLTAFAGEVTFDFTAENAAETYGFPPYSVNEATNQGEADYIIVPKVITSGDVTITLKGNETTDKSGAWRIWSDGLRQYKSQDAWFTVETTNGEKITGVSWTVANNNVLFALEGTTEALPDYWTGEETEVSFVSVSTGNQGVKTITVTYGDDEIDTPTPAPEGVITVTEALQLISEGYTYKVQVGGIITSITEIDTDQYGNATYVISDNANDTEGLTVFRGYWLGGQKFTSEDQLAVGAEVVVEGSLMNYNNTTPELAQGNFIVSYNGETAPEPETPNAIFSESFATSLGDFTIEDVTLSEGVSYVWSYASGYGAKATAYVGGNHAAQSWLISPVIDLEGYKNVVLSFDQAVNYANGEEVAEACQVFAGVAGTAKDSWINLSSKVNYPEGTNWTFVNSGEISLDELAGQKIQLGFLYTSTDAVSMTWEIKNLIVDGEEGEIDGVEGIEADINAPVEFFNLQGVRVANPDNGIFIRRQGNKTSKVIIR